MIATSIQVAIAYELHCVRAFAIRPSLNKMSDKTWYQGCATGRLLSCTPLSWYTFYKCWYTSDKFIELKSIIQERDPTIMALPEVRPKSFTYEICHEQKDIVGNMIQTNTLNRWGRGMFLCLIEGLNFKESKLRHNFSECLMCAIRMKSVGKLLIGIVCRHPNSSDENDEELLTMFNEIEHSNC